MNTENPQAFPVGHIRIDQYKNKLNDQSEGMTLRDYFAAKAMQGMLMNPNITNEMFGSLDDDLVFLSYEYADEMLKERSKAKDQ